MKNSAFNPGNKDQRIFERISCDLEVHLKKLRYIGNNRETKFYLSKVLNFSGMGFNIKTNLHLIKGEQIELQINHYESSNPINQLAKVKWKQKAATGEWLIGLEFPSYNLTQFIPLMSYIRHNDSYY